MKTKHKLKAKDIVAIILAVTLVLSIGYSIYGIVTSPLTGGSEAEYVRSDYVLMLLECIVGLIVMFLPTFLKRKWTLPIPDYMYILYFVFLYCGIYLGEVRNFFYVVPHWDIYLHVFSGGMLGCLGFLIVRQLNQANRVAVNLGPVFVCLFSLCFAVTIGVLWEVYEYLADSILLTNMQKFRLADGTVLTGHDALSDTMTDLMVDFAGAFIAVSIGYFSIIKKKKAVDNNRTETVSNGITD